MLRKAIELLKYRKRKTEVKKKVFPVGNRKISITEYLNEIKRMRRDINNLQKSGKE